ncbi:peptide ABC transporter permease [Oenococcus kitaharae]|nr:peptide ABC transporter permease [Oenococcus kitaharae]OEY83160.1 peptide ABC transporter permease [Oenococcus kitaharae]OEY84670.1 peptide ABC transporter permease [Oenococcus kitaharae]
MEQSESQAHAHSFLKAAVREFKRDKIAMISFFFLVIVVFGVFIGSMFIPRDAFSNVDIMDTNLAPFTNGHILGTDDGGRDEFLLVVIAARNSLSISIPVTIVIMAVGIFLGLMSAYYGGFFDWIWMRITDYLSIVPTLMILLTLLTIINNYSIWTLVWVISLFSWIGSMRFFRALTFAERENDYVKASKLSGSSSLAIMWKQIFPNLSSQFYAQTALAFAGNIGLETGISYLGYGLPYTTPSLGTLVNKATDPEVMTQSPWMWLPASFLILALSVSLIFIGQALRRVADQRQSLA